MEVDGLRFVTFPPVLVVNGIDAAETLFVHRMQLPPSLLGSVHL